LLNRDESGPPCGIPLGLVWRRTATRSGFARLTAEVALARVDLGERLAGVLSCYDRIIVTGALLGACYVKGMTGFLSAADPDLRLSAICRTASRSRARARARRRVGECRWHYHRTHCQEPHPQGGRTRQGACVRGDRPGLAHIGQRGEKRGGATEERNILGFSISNDLSERRIAPKVLDKFKMQIREMTRRTRAISPQRLIEELTPYIIGWRGYFGFCQTTRVLANLEAWIRKVLKLIPQGAAIAP
jgi:hypothetical protein